MIRAQFGFNFGGNHRVFDPGQGVLAISVSLVGIGGIANNRSQQGAYYEAGGSEFHFHDLSFSIKWTGVRMIQLFANPICVLAHI